MMERFSFSDGNYYDFTNAEYVLFCNGDFSIARRFVQTVYVSYVLFISRVTSYFSQRPRNVELTIAQSGLFLML